MDISNDRQLRFEIFRMLVLKFSSFCYNNTYVSFICDSMKTIERTIKGN
jgi:hypothetical protein